MVSDINIKGTNHKIGGSQADGQWVRKDFTVFSGTPFSATGTPTYTVSNYLPDDEHEYEVIVCSYATTGAAANDTNTWWVGDIDVHFVQNMGYSRTRTASTTWSAGEGIIPVKQVNGTLYLRLNVTGVGSNGTGNNGLYLRGYRRLGGSGTPEVHRTLTINPTPADATVSFDKGAIVGNTCTVTEGTVVTYTVSRNGYRTQSGTVTVNADQTVNVTLVAPYTPNQVLYESSTGGASTTLNLLTSGRYQVICVAGGGNGHGIRTGSGLTAAYRVAGGGSGSGFNCVFQLTAGSYAVSVGAGGAKSTTVVNNGGDSRFGTCYARGGKGSSIRGDTAGAGGAAPTLTYTRTTTSLNAAGNAGSKGIGTSDDARAAGGAAVYSSYGKGGDGQSGGSAGTVGYVKVIYIGA